MSPISRMPSLPRYISHFILSFIIALAAIMPGSTSRAATDFVPFIPVTAMYLIKDSSSQYGYKEKFRWTINSPNDWDRFYKTLPNLALDKTVNPDPLKSKVDDMIVLTRNDTNKLTGFDIYLSSLGIMVVNREANHYYYPDKNKLWAFLQEEQKQQASFDSFTRGEIDTKALGIVVTYNINENIPNPAWVVEGPESIRTYDTYFKAIKPYTDFELQWSVGDQNFDGFGVFILNLNYARAPARIATVSKTSIRLSNSFVSTKFYQDTEDYYNFFKSQARDMINYNEKYKDGENEAIDKRQF